MGGVLPCCSRDEHEARELAEAQEAEENEEDEVNPGPTAKRRCTDVLCLPFFLVYLATFAAVCVWLRHVSDLRVLEHGMDHNGNFCGSRTRKDTPLIYYPRLHADYREDRTLTTKYGVCVASCPGKGDTIKDSSPDARQHTWFVPLATFPIANRCLPYKTEGGVQQGPELCAWPPCLPDSPARYARNVCGLKKDHTDEYWLLGQPDESLKRGWVDESVQQQEINERCKATAHINETVQKSCEIKVVKKVNLEFQQNDETMVLQLVSHYTGLFFTNAKVLQDNWATIVFFGVLGAMILSFIIIVSFSSCVQCATYTFVSLMLLALSALNYILFVRANVLSGRTGKKITALFGQQQIEKSELLMASESEWQSTYLVGAVCLSIGIVLLCCLLHALTSKLNILIALLNQSAQTLREMPSLLCFPFLGLASLICCSLLLMGAAVRVMVVQPKVVVDWLEMNIEDDGMVLQEHVHTARKMFLYAVVFSFLWLYFFHRALFSTTVAGAISHWYFYRNDPERNAGTGRYSQGYFFGRPVLFALGRVLRYHLGSIAMGSFLVAACHVPRLALEYATQQLKQETAPNPLAATVVRITGCCLWCFEKCMKYLTDQAFIQISVTGKPFCRAAVKVADLIVRHPVQAAMDSLASSTLEILACLLVPAAMVFSSSIFLPVNGWGVCASTIAGLSYMVARMVAGVYDVVLSALFVCLIRDEDKFQGRYGPRELQIAFGIKLPLGSQAVPSALAEPLGVELPGLPERRSSDV
eukprot:TRINITY_DN89740_c0_g1_i1.p1 TRINITY_DN89740_c0_g1~~TRINITY_DN89740_c0_g1_i1.p1  ORF type:complete len:757 (+),score=88.28 TRINITY_DN89740_c0_g1_i1:103-2373(+)